MQKRELGARLVALRGNRGQEEVATAVGISRRALNMYESDGRVPRDEVKIKLAGFYGVSVQALFLPRNDTDSVIAE